MAIDEGGCHKTYEALQQLIQGQCHANLAWLTVVRRPGVDVARLLLGREAAEALCERARDLNLL